MKGAETLAAQIVSGGQPDREPFPSLRGPYNSVVCIQAKDKPRAAQGTCLEVRSLPDFHPNLDRDRRSAGLLIDRPDTPSGCIRGRRCRRGRSR